MKTPLIALALLLAACGGATPVAKNPRPLARAGVDLAKDAWVLMANACIDASETTGDMNLAKTCGKPLEAAHDLIVSAATAVDTNWSAHAACDLEAAAVILEGALPLVGAAGPAVAPTVKDAVSLAALLAGNLCQLDGGAP